MLAMQNKRYCLNRYDFKLPDELIAQQPVSPRDSSRLLIINRRRKSLCSGRFRDITAQLKKGDVLVLNNTRVINARLSAQRASGAKLEVLLLKPASAGGWEALVNPARRAKVGEILHLLTVYEGTAGWGGYIRRSQLVGVTYRLCRGGDTWPVGASPRMGHIPIHVRMDPSLPDIIP